MLVSIVKISCARELPAAYLIAGLSAKLRLRDVFMLPASCDWISERLAQLCAFLGMSYRVIRLEEAESALATLGGGAGGLPALAAGESGRQNPWLVVYSTLYPDGLLGVESTRDDLSAVGSRTRNRPCVIAVGAQETEQACQFAILTGRPLVVMNLGGLNREFFTACREACSLYLSVPNSFTGGDLEGILRQKAAAANEVPIGFFYPYGTHHREFSVLKSGLMSRADSVADLPYRFYYSTVEAGEYFEVGRSQFFFGRHDKQSVAAAVGSDCLYAFSRGHCNGIDAGMSSVVLCPLLDLKDAQEQAPRRAPRCFHGEVCKRESPGVQLLPVAAVKARVLYLSTCFGVLLRKGLCDVEASLAHQVAASSSIGVFVTNYSLAYLGERAGIELAQGLSRNERIGAAIESINRRSQERLHDIVETLILFGDPEFCTGSQTPLFKSDLVTSHPLLARLFKTLRLKLESDRISQAGEAPPPPVIPDSFFRALAFQRCWLQAQLSSQIEELLAAAAGDPERSARVHAVRELLLGVLAAIEQLWLKGMRLKQARSAVSDLWLEPSAATWAVCSLIASLHESWSAFFSEYCTRFSILLGLLELYVNSCAVYPAAPSQCAYCGEPALRRFRWALVSEPETISWYVTCVNCGPLFLGVAPTMMGQIDTDDTWRSGTSHGIRVQLQTELRGSFRVLVVAALQGAGPGLDGRLPFAQLAETVEVSLPQVCLPPLSVSLRLEMHPGLYDLNVLILLDEQFVHLRRTICVESGEHGAITECAQK